MRHIEMRRGRHTPKRYRHRELMDELNEFFINCKVHLLDLPLNRPKPTSEEMDSLMGRLMEVLEKDQEDPVKW